MKTEGAGEGGGEGRFLDCGGILLPRPLLCGDSNELRMSLCTLSGSVVMVGAQALQGQDEVEWRLTSRLWDQTFCWISC